MMGKEDDGKGGSKAAVCPRAEGPAPSQAPPKASGKCRQSRHHDRTPAGFTIYARRPAPQSPVAQARQGRFERVGIAGDVKGLQARGRTGGERHRVALPEDIDASMVQAGEPVVVEVTEAMLIRVGPG